MRFLLSPKTLAIVGFIAVIAIRLQQYLLNHDNNYLIFTRVFLVLQQHGILYEAHPQYYFDLFKYSPTFALIIGSLVKLPDLLGIIIWNALNYFVLFFACLKLFNYRKEASILLWMILPDCISALQNSQSNCLLAGLMVYTFVNLEQKKYLSAALTLASGFFVKIFGLAAAAVAIFYKQKPRFILYSCIAFIIFALLPLVIVSPQILFHNYSAWMQVVNDTPSAIQLSVMGVFNTFSPIHVSPVYIQIIGLVLLLLPLIHTKMYGNEFFRRSFLTSLLIFVVIFNTMSESPTFIIAVVGFCIWLVSVRRINRWEIALLIFMYIVVTFYYSLFPASIRDGIFHEYKIKAYPMILAWFTIQYHLLFPQRAKDRVIASNL